MINLLIFDLDGTLFDTAAGICNAFNRCLKSRGQDPIPDHIIRAHIGTGLRTLVQEVEEETKRNLGDLSVLETDFYRHYDQNFLLESTPYPGLYKFLTEWPHKLAVVSNKNEYYVRELVSKSELRDFSWEKIVGGDTYSVKKPHAYPLDETMKHLKVNANQTLMIGDGEPDIISAQNAGVRSVAVAFGYSPISVLIQLGADASLSSYEDLPKIIQYFE